MCTPFRCVNGHFNRSQNQSGQPEILTVKIIHINLFILDQIPNILVSNIRFWCEWMWKVLAIKPAKHHFNYPKSCGLARRSEAEETQKCIREGKIESENVSHNDSLIIARIEDEIRRQIGVKYPENDWIVLDLWNICRASNLAFHLCKYQLF